jgi:excisionase family DNA binding protein
MVTVTEAAAVLGVSANTLKRAGEEGEIPVERIRSVYLVPAAWLAKVTAWPREEVAS